MDIIYGIALVITIIIFAIIGNIFYNPRAGRGRYPRTGRFINTPKFFILTIIAAIIIYFGTVYVLKSI